jgi:hypothetical protein
MSIREKKKNAIEYTKKRIENTKLYIRYHSPQGGRHVEVQKREKMEMIVIRDREG